MHATAVARARASTALRSAERHFPYPRQTYSFSGGWWLHDDPPSGVVRSLAVAATVAVVAGVGLSSFFRAPEHQAWPQARADATFASKPQHWARFPLPGQSTVLPWQHDKPAEAINRAIVPTPQAPSHH